MIANSQRPHHVDRLWDILGWHERTERPTGARVAHEALMHIADPGVRCGIDDPPGDDVLPGQVWQELGSSHRPGGTMGVGPGLVQEGTGGFTPSDVDDLLRI